MNIDSATLRFPCPSCLNYFEQSLADIKKNHSLSCPCGQKITIDDQELKAACKEIRKNLKMQEILSNPLPGKNSPSARLQPGAR